MGKTRPSGKRYVYFWADGIYFNVRLEDTENKRQCFLINRCL
jgi:putative transposase